MDGNARFLGGIGGKTGLNVGKWTFSQGLSRDFSSLSLTHQNTLFYTKFTPPPPNIKKHQRILKKLYFWTNFKQFPHFEPSPLPILGLSFRFYDAPYPTIIEVTLAKISFSKLMPIQSYSGKTLGGVNLIPPSLGIRRVKTALIKLMGRLRGGTLKRSRPIHTVWFVVKTCRTYMQWQPCFFDSVN